MTLYDLEWSLYVRNLLLRTALSEFIFTHYRTRIYILLLHATSRDVRKRIVIRRISGIRRKTVANVLRIVGWRLLLGWNSTWAIKWQNVISLIIVKKLQLIHTLKETCESHKQVILRSIWDFYGIHYTSTTRKQVTVLKQKLTQAGLHYITIAL